MPNVEISLIGVELGVWGSIVGRCVVDTPSKLNAAYMSSWGERCHSSQSLIYEMKYWQEVPNAAKTQWLQWQTEIPSFPELGSSKCPEERQNVEMMKQPNENEVTYIAMEDFSTIPGTQWCRDETKRLAIYHERRSKLRRILLASRSPLRNYIHKGADGKGTIGVTPIYVALLAKLPRVPMNKTIQRETMRNVSVSCRWCGDASDKCGIPSYGGVFVPPI